MKRALKAELWKAFHNPMLWLAMAGGAVIVVMSVIDCARDMAEWTRVTGDFGVTAPDVTLSTEGYSLFILSLPYRSTTLTAFIFYQVWPILAAIPYGASYMQDRRTGVYNQVVSRIGRKKYYFSKYIAVFITGGLVVSLTLLTGILADAMVVPFWKVRLQTVMVVRNGMFLSKLYYTNPWLHILCWTVVTFFIGGCTACVTFFAWTGLRLQVLVMVMPYAIYFVVSTLLAQLSDLGVISSGSLLNKLSYVFYMPTIRNPHFTVWMVFGFILVMTAATLVGGYLQVTGNELD